MVGGRWSIIEATRGANVRKTLPFELEIAKPCQQSWGEMNGSATARHCSSCNKSVHNLAAMSTRGIADLIAESDGHLCARIMRRPDGSIVTADASARGCLISRAAGVLVGAALSAGAAAAQRPTEPSKNAIVTGTVHDPQGLALERPAEVWFVTGGSSVMQVSTNAVGEWRAELAPGTYDVIVRNGPMFGERMKAVELHAGEQSFAPLNERFDLGHLGIKDHGAQETVLMGELTATYRYSVSYIFKHPLRYMKNLRHNFG
jgi:hypothetical protein